MVSAVSKKYFISVSYLFIWSRLLLFAFLLQQVILNVPQLLRKIHIVGVGIIKSFDLVPELVHLFQAVFPDFFAKLGSDMKKPDAVTVIPEDRFKEMIWHLPASEMLGVGRATEKKLSSCGIRTIGDIANWPVDFFTRRLGKCGTDLWRFANGLDNSQVMTRDTEVPEKTVGHGITTLQDLENPAEVWKVMLALSQEKSQVFF